jgi:hypothetical protein
MGPLIRRKIEELRKDDKLDEAVQLIDAANKMRPSLAEPYLTQIKNIEEDVRKKLATRGKESGILPRNQPVLGSGR